MGGGKTLFGTGKIRFDWKNLKMMTVSVQQAMLCILHTICTHPTVYMYCAPYYSQYLYIYVRCIPFLLTDECYSSIPLYT